MPEPGDPYANAFVSDPMQCWRMIHDRQGQADHCGRDAVVDRTLVQSQATAGGAWSCPDHIEGLTGLREFGRRR